MLKALDTETTGVDFFHGCRPFYVSITKEDASVRSWEWHVDPMTRMPIVPDKDKHELWQELHDPNDIILMHNAKFDMRACHTILPDLRIREIFNRVQDTVLMHHCLDSGESHKLKDAALKYGNVPDDDQQTLKEAVNAARAYGKKLKWAIASSKTLPLQKNAPKDGWWVVDMWMPRAYMQRLWTTTGDEEWSPELPRGQRHPWWDVCGTYGDLDTLRTLVIFKIFREALEQEGLNEQYEERRLQLPIIYESEQHGVTLDLHLVDKEIVRCESETDRYASIVGHLLKRPTFNPRSDKQLQDALFNQLKLPITKTTEAGNPSTDKDVMVNLLKFIEDEESDFQPILPPKTHAAAYRKLCHDVVINIVTAKKYMTAISYMDGYKRASRLVTKDGEANVFEASEDDLRKPHNSNIWHLLHPSFNLTGTVTTRYSSSNPNMQNVGKGKEAFIDEIKATVKELTLRKLFGPAPWREWWAVDGKQLQLVIFAYISGNKEMIAALEGGMDIHEFTQRMIFTDSKEGFVKESDSQRTIAKNVNFGRVFGAGDSKIEMTAQMPGLCKRLDERLPGIREFMDKNVAFASKHGYIEAAGYRMMVPRDTLYAATNYLVQGWEGKIVQRAMIYWDKYIRENCPEAFMPLQVHDELIVDFPKGEGDVHIAALCDLFRQAGRELLVPCDVDAKYIEKRWDQGVKVVVTAA